MNRFLTNAMVFCLALSSALCFANETRTAKLEQYVVDAKERLQLSDDQIERIAPVLGESLDRQLGILQRYGISADGPSQSGRQLGIREARAMKKELDQARSATLASVGKILTKAQLDEFVRMQDERQDAVRSRIRNRN